MFGDQYKRAPGWIKLLNWEYWPSPAYYFPMLFYFPYLTLRSRHPCFFTAANPSIYTGGIGVESKYQTLQLIPKKYRPNTLLVNPTDSIEHIRAKLTNHAIGFPLIAKPDVGYRGLMVHKIETEMELTQYLKKHPFPFLLQEFLAGEAEFGVFYVRFPNDTRGRVTSITLKEFLHVTGDGQSTLLELILQSPRAILQLERLKQSYGSRFATVPAKGEYVELGVVGNHSKGTAFFNGNHLIDPTIDETFDRISKQIPGFYYGRYDIKCNGLQDLRTGQNIKIIELNGVCSEPTYIYDPSKSSYWGAIGTILKHWSIIRKISEQNHQKGAPYLSPLTMIKAFKDLRAYMIKVRRISKNKY